MPIQNDEECKQLIDKLDKGLPPQMIDEIISYLEKTNNSEFTMTLVKYLNNQNIQSRNSVWALSSQIAMVGEDVGKIKEHLGIT
ncbi:hypothetical protein Nisw_08355 [Candidatus Nitrosopumilus sp. SW]|uniref:hypothetical protein n=1 Tax=Candidatus Nitrosopumilus sp. SW TaxID=2508726 RepID=UPI00114F725C|nr:hypothetical protein [Candidatus Nitrosopumilus sp. SW]QDI89531.1 hypothetical protein Nisw_08355 [Candidatus Nitrosopumilus sp. SW]